MIEALRRGDRRRGFEQRGKSGVRYLPVTVGKYEQKLAFAAFAQMPDEAFDIGVL